MYGRTRFARPEVQRDLIELAQQFGEHIGQRLRQGLIENMPEEVADAVLRLGSWQINGAIPPNGSR